MLIDFEVENFLSFKNNTILSMETGQRLKKFKDNTFTKNKFSLLKSSIVFGAKILSIIMCKHSSRVEEC